LTAKETVCGSVGHIAIASIKLGEVVAMWTDAESMKKV